MFFKLMRIFNYCYITLKIKINQAKIQKIQTSPFFFKKITET